MNLNQIQALLETLSDQQIMQYAQGSNPQVPQVLAQMEALRRENLRKSEIMQVPGMKAGGVVRGYAEGGRAEAIRKRVSDRLSREKDLQQSDSATESGIALLPTPAAKGQPELMSDAYSAQWNRMAQNMAPTPSVDPQADARATAVLAQGPTPFQLGQTPGAPGQRTTPPGGIADLPVAETAPTSTGPVPVVPGVVANPQATPEVLAKVSQAADAESSKFADQYREIFAQRADLRESGRSAKPNADLDRKQAFYYALAKFGATLATTGVWAQAGDVGLESFRSELEKSKAKQDEFRKESLQIGLAALDDKLAALGVDEKERQRMRDEAQKALENMRENRKLDLQEKQIKQQGEYQKGQLSIQKTLADARSVGVGALKPLTFTDALKQAEDEMKANPLLLKNKSLEQRALELMAADPVRTGTLAPKKPNFGLDPSAIDAELARRSGG